MEFVCTKWSRPPREFGLEAPWKWEGEKWTGVPHGVPDGVWALMTEEGVGVAWPPGVCGPALITEGDGAGECEGALGL